MNVFIRFGYWLAKAPLEVRVTELEKQTAQIAVLETQLKDLKSEIAKLEMWTGLKRLGSTKGDIKQVIEAWQGPIS